MLLPGQNLVKVYQDMVRTGQGVSGYLKEFAQMLGYHRTPYGPAVGKNALFDPREFSLPEVVAAFVGSDEHRSMRHAYESGLAMEAGGAITTAQLAPVSASYGTIAGLLNAERLKAYNNQETIGKDLVTWVSPVNAEEVKIWRYSDPTEVFDDLQEGQERPTANFNADWVRAQKMKEQGMTLNVSWRAVHFAADSVATMDRAKAQGNRASWVVEDRILDVIFGLRGSYKYGVSSAGDTETEYETYIASGGPYANYQTNELVNEGSLDTANILLRNMTDPNTGLPIDMGATKYLVVSPFYERLATQLARFQQTIIGADTAAERLIVGQTTALGIVPKVSARMVSRQTTLGFQGGALTETQAKKRWVYGDTKTAFQYRQARDFTQVVSTVLEDRSLARHGLIITSTYDEMGSCSVVEPRAATLNRND